LVFFVIDEGIDANCNLFSQLFPSNGNVAEGNGNFNHLMEISTLKHASNCFPFQGVGLELHNVGILEGIGTILASAKHGWFSLVSK